MPFQYENYRSPYIGAIADLMRQTPEQQGALAVALAKISADQANTQALIRARAWGNVGQSAMDAANAIQRERELKPQREMQALQLGQAKQELADAALFRQAISAGPQGRQFLQSLGPQGVGALQKLDAYAMAQGEAQQKQVAMRDNALQPYGYELVNPQNDPVQTWNRVREQLGAKGLVSPQELQALDQGVTSNPAEAPMQIGKSILQRTKEGREALAKFTPYRPGMIGINETTGEQQQGPPATVTPQSQWQSVLQAAGLDAQGKPNVEKALEMMRRDIQSSPHFMYLEGVGNVPIEVIPGTAEKPIQYRYQGQDVTGKVRKPPDELPAAIRTYQWLMNQGVGGGGAAGGGPQAVSPYRPPAEKANIPDKRLGGLTPNAVFEGALDWALTGRVPSTSRGGVQIASQLQRDAITATGAAQLAEAGVDASQLRAEHAAETAALKKLTYTANATAAVAAGANNQIDLAIEASKNLPRSGSKMVNRFSQWLSGNLQPTDALSVFVYSGGARRRESDQRRGGSIAGVPVSAAEKADRLLSAAQAHSTFVSAANAMKKDVGAVAEPLMNQLKQTMPETEKFLRAINGYGTTAITQQNQNQNVPNLSGLAQGVGRTFNSGPFAGQTWTIGPDNQPKQIK